MWLRLLKVEILYSRTIILLMVIIQNGFSKPQDSGMSEMVASQTLTVAGNIAEMVGNAGMISKQNSFDLPFAKANSETLVGAGAAMRNNDNDSSEEERRKRFIDSQIIKNSLVGGEESWLVLPFFQRSLHRSKRAPCHHGGAGTGGSGGGTGTPTNGDDLDVAERRRRAYARRRKLAARKRATTNKKTTVSRTRKLINDDDNVNQALTRRRKRQTELDDLNNNIANSGNKFSQHAQQIADKLRQVWENFMNLKNNVAQSIKQHLSGQNSTSPTEI